MDRRRFLALALCAAASTRVSAVGAANFYTTEFSTSEDPVSEAGRWINGKAVGLDWQNVRTTQGFATFAQPNPGGLYDDATALLAGNWGPDQHVRTVVHLPSSNPNFPPEVEIRLRSTLSAHVNSGYEVLNGTQIVRWNGPVGDFTVLNDEGPYGVVRHGDIFEATIVGNVITVFLNGARINRAVDNVFTSGRPGVGFYTNDPSPAPFGFSSFTASDGPLGANPPPSAPFDFTLR